MGAVGSLNARQFPALALEAKRESSDPDEITGNIGKPSE
tara:strand:+ start:307 stop:423 length:117 start_codon:yes stop_codon:yes gene_type:complete